jgi:DNA-binding FrmR family transcriptional regulator
MASFIAQDLAEGEEYQDVVSQVARVSSELARARNQLVSLEIQIEAVNTNPDIAEVSAKVGALTRELNNVSSYIVRVPSNVEIAEEVRGQFTAYDPTPVVEVPVDKIRGRTAVMMGAVLGVGGAWVGLNRRMLLDQLRSMGGNELEAEDDEGEDMEVED